MRKVLLGLVIGFAVLFSVTQASAFFPGFLDGKFSWQNLDKIIVNGEVYNGKITPLSGNSRLIEWADGSGKPAPFYWVERLDKGGRLIWQASPVELSTFEYWYDENGRVVRSLAKIIWPELHRIFITPNLKRCDPAETPACYRLKENAIYTDVQVKRDKSGKIVEGIMRNTFFLENGDHIEKVQRMKVSYPRTDVMRIEFEGFGKPWSYVDAWQEYRIEDGKLVWETCRTFGERMCGKK